MKKINILFLILIGVLLTGCTKSNIDIFRFVNHEVEIEVGKQATLDLILGEYSSDSKIIYSLSTEDVVALDSGVAYALAVGEVTVSATIDNIKYARMIVKVVNVPISSMKINAPANVVLLNQSLNLTVSVFPANLPNNVVWSIEKNNQISFNPAIISSNGILTAIQTNATGVKVIVVATSTYDPTMSAKIEILVKNP